MNFKFSIFWKLLFILFIGLNGQNSHAQTHPTTLKFSTQESIQVNDHNVFSIVMKLENVTDDTINARLKLAVPYTVKSLSQDNLKLTLLPQKRAFIPLKFTLNKTQQAGNVPLEFRIINEKDATELGFSKTIIQIEKKRSLKIFPIQSNLLYKQEGDSLHYEVNVINAGNQAENLLITNSYTDYNGIVVTENKKVEVSAFQEKVVRFSKYITHDLMKMESYTTNITAYNEEGVFVGNVFYTIYNANSNRRYVDPNSKMTTNSDYTSNYVRVNLRDVSSQNQNINFMAHQDFSFGLNEFSYNINSSNWLRINQATLSDTWASFQRNGRGIRVGTISNNELDVPINGRGVMLYQNMQKDDQKIVVGAAESNYNLLDDFSINQLLKKSTLFTQTKLLIHENELESSILYDRSGEANNLIVNSSYKFITPRKWTHYLRFGYGFSRNSEIKFAESSLAATANVSGNIGKFSFYSTNYFSSGYYPGTRRGALFLNQRIQRSFQQYSMWASFTLTNNNPKPYYQVVKEYNRTNDSRALRADLGINFKLNNQINISFSPKINIEKSYVLDEDSFQNKEIDFRSTYINNSISWLSHSRTHQLIFNSYAGFYKLNNFPSSKPVLFGQFLWSFKQLQLNTSYQKGSMMIGEILSTNSYTDEIKRFNFSLSYSNTFFRNRLMTKVSSYYNYDINYGNTFTFGVNAQYKLLDQLQVTANLNISQYDTRSYVSKQNYMQFGMQYNLPDKRETSSKKYGNLNVFVYYDYNANGIFDEGDRVSEDRIVKINESNFITSAAGQILYKKVPYGEYRISIPGQKWYTEDYTVLVQAKTTTIAIPLQLTGVIRGKVNLQKTSDLEYKTTNNLTGLTLVFVHESGRKYEVKTNDRGEYYSYLPIGNYTFTILELTLPPHVYPTVFQHKVNIESEKNTTYDPITLKVKQKSVNIKRFGS